MSTSKGEASDVIRFSVSAIFSDNLNSLLFATSDVHR
jgi:hypothetical protein